MNKSKNNSFFEAKVLPALQFVAGIFALAYSLLEFIVKYFMIIVIVAMIGLIIFCIIAKEFGIALIGIIVTAGWYFFYWLFYQKDKKKRK
ncbi:hypothetical protein MUG87_18535 [Ectobacillus sp. JY-23]|uniref:hypothetical protein n=1 Tax=Ectobacillus sp. JY-23 TaxID=2933872 RepID=UPI001FF369B4|nr:hypothetical protein [Ectobacillus sp. JY-23]UOY92395.1 hypothetical protein MUG87_18535 [Ectobacillus sp. JY-23]